MNAMNETITIRTEYIKLQDALQLAGLVRSGGEAKTVVQAGEVSVNGRVCTERGRKLRPGDEVSFAGKTLQLAYGN